MTQQIGIQNDVHENTPILAEASIPPDSFDEGYRTANCCSVLFYIFGNKLINRVNKNGGQLEKDMVIDMRSSAGETEKLTAFY